jgi:exopolyphosphatase/pppGpp-phosphohydrolase
MYYTQSDTSTLQPMQLGEVFSSSSDHTFYSLENGLCAKIYNEPNKSTELISKIKQMIGINLDIQSVCWPIELVFNKEEDIVGVVMRTPKGHPLSTLFDREHRRSLFSQWTRIDLCDLALTILKDVAELHEQNIIIGNLSEDSLLVQDAHSVSFTNTEQYQVGEFLCPTQTALYLAPELTHVNLTTVPRTEKHERFSICVLLFKILMAGQNPFEIAPDPDDPTLLHRGGFSYPSSISMSQHNTEYTYHPLWTNMDAELRTLFFNTFAKDQLPSIWELAASIFRFKEQLVNEKFVTALDFDNHRNTRSTSLKATKIDDGRKKGMGDPQNIFGDAETPFKLGVLELSTRACKVLIADVRNLQDGFTWNACENRSFLTELGQLVTLQGEIPWDDFEELVLPKIQLGRDFLRQHNVDVFHCVATAALRGANNREFILQKLKDLLDLNVQILDRNDEAEATFSAFRWYLPQNIDLIGHTALMDQGGGSTELSTFALTESGGIQKTIFEDKDGKHLPTNIPVGTTTAVNNFLNQSQYDTDMRTALENSQRLNRDHVTRATRPMLETKYTYLVGVGSAITKATNKNANRKQHGVILTYEELEAQQNALADELSDDFTVIGELKDHFSRHPEHTSQHKRTRERLVKYFGLRMVLQVMDRLNIKSMVVNGMGLRYGIYNQMLNTIYPEIRSNMYNDRFKSKSTSVNGVVEHTYVDGIITGIVDYGMFIRLPNGDSGLLHKSKFKHRDDLIFESGKPLLVYVNSITQDPHRGGWKYGLSLPSEDVSSPSPTYASTVSVETLTTKPKKRVRVRQQPAVAPRIRRRKKPSTDSTSDND